MLHNFLVIPRKFYKYSITKYSYAHHTYPDKYPAPLSPLNKLSHFIDFVYYNDYEGRQEKLMVFKYKEQDL